MSTTTPSTQQPQQQPLAAPGTPSHLIPEVPSHVGPGQPTASFQVRRPPVDPYSQLQSSWEQVHPEEVSTVSSVMLSSAGSRQDSVFAPSRV